jgi:hypothetical protein
MNIGASSNLHIIPIWFLKLSSVSPDLPCHHNRIPTISKPKWTPAGLLLASIKVCLMIDEPTNHTFIIYFVYIAVLAQLNVARQLGGGWLAIWVYLSCSVSLAYFDALYQTSSQLQASVSQGVLLFQTDNLSCLCFPGRFREYYLFI